MLGPPARLDFYRQVLHALRGHVAIGDRIENLPLARMPRKKSADPAEWPDVRDAAHHALEVARVKAICIDEAQHLMHSDVAQRPRVQLDWLNSLTDREICSKSRWRNFSLYDFCYLKGG